MRKSEIYALLGLTLDICIRRFHFPTLDMDIFSPRDYGKLRNQLSKAPANDLKLGQQMIQLLLKGKVEEIKTKEETLILSVQFQHKKELYIAELKLENYKWVFLSVHYAGEAIPTKRMGMWAGISVVALSILLFSALFIVHYFQEQEEASSDISEATRSAPSVPAAVDPQSTQEEALPLSELEEMARKMDLVLINEEEYQNLLQEKELQIANNGAIQKEGDHEELDGETAKGENPSVAITVYYGMSAEKVAKLLVDSEVEVAQDVDELINYFIEQNIQYRIRTGTHEIPLDASYMDIVHILTTRK